VKDRSKNKNSPEAGSVNLKYLLALLALKMNAGAG
jgi:hypothetical protein